MKIVVVGGTGLIGSKVVAKLVAHGHEAIAASPNTGVDTLTGEGLAAALEGAQVVVDVSNSPSFADDDVLRFFETSTGNMLAAEAEAGVTQHVALSVVGADGLPESGYLRAKVAQENLIEHSGRPYSIVRATQFFEFVPGIAQSATVQGEIRLPTALVRPIAADDVATAVARAAAGEPTNSTLDIAGPEEFQLDEIVREDLAARGDERQVVTDPEARYFGARPQERSLVPGPDATIFQTRFTPGG